MSFLKLLVIARQTKKCLLFNVLNTSDTLVYSVDRETIRSRFIQNIGFIVFP